MTGRASAGAAARRMVVTGGSGFLGRVVVDVARRAGWDVVGTGFTTAGGGLVRLDVRDRPMVDRLVAEARPHAVVHTAYVKDGPDARSVIVDGSAHVARAAAAGGARLVHLSTDIVFSGRAGRPYTEDDPPDPVLAYGRDKADAEARVAAVAPGAVIVRTSLIFGGPSRPGAPPERMARDPGVAHYTDELRSPILVDDLAEALVELCGAAGVAGGAVGASGVESGPTGAAGVAGGRLDVGGVAGGRLDAGGVASDAGAPPGVAGVLHVGGGDHVSRWELACLLAGPGCQVRAATAPPGRPLDCRLDSSRAREVLRTPLRGVREVVGAGGHAVDRP